MEMADIFIKIKSVKLFKLRSTKNATISSKQKKW